MAEPRAVAVHRRPGFSGIALILFALAFPYVLPLFY